MQTKVCFKQFSFLYEIYIKNLYPKKTKCHIQNSVVLIFSFKKAKKKVEQKPNLLERKLFSKSLRAGIKIPVPKNGGTKVPLPKRGGNKFPLPKRN